jgi:hypothetical protein
MANADVHIRVAAVRADLRAAFPEPGFVSTEESDLVRYSRSLNPQYTGVSTEISRAKKLKRRVGDDRFPSQRRGPCIFNRRRG